MSGPRTSRRTLAAAVVVAALTGALAYGRYHTASAWFAGGWEVALIVVTVAAGLAFGFGVYRRVAVWVAGSGRLSVAGLGHRVARVVRVALLQRKVLRDRVAGAMHFALSWCFGLLLLWYTAQSVGLDVKGVPDVLLDIGYAVLGTAALTALVLRFISDRRALSPSPRDARHPLRRRRDVAVIVLLALVSVSYFADRAAGGSIASAPTTEWVRFVHVLTISAFLALIPYTKLFHVVTAPLSVFFAAHDAQRVPPLPFDLSRDSMETLVAQDGSFGLSDVHDLPLFRLLSLDACTECGRCTAVCPAAQSEKPLSPMSVVMKLRDAALDHDDLWDVFSREEVLSCTTCGRCVAECPVQIEHVGMITDLRRDLVYEGAMADGHQRTMQRLVEDANPYGQPAATRGAWALSDGFEEAKDGETYDYLYWLGCAASFDDRAQTVARTVHRLLTRAGLRVAILGSRERCTGDPARRVGDEALFQQLALANIESIRDVQFGAIITHCPHCFNTVGNEYRLLGADFEVRHHTEVLAELVASGAIELKHEIDQSVTFHDPCYLGRHNGVFDAPRALLDAVPSLDLVEMARSRDKSACCGAGGGQMWLGEDWGEKINVMRVQDAEQTGSRTVVTACPFCIAMLEEGAQVTDAQDPLQVKDVAELIAEAAEQ